MVCTHYWRLGLPVKGVVTGHCLHCRRLYKRKEPVFADWNLAVVQERRWNDAPAPLNDW